MKESGRDERSNKGGENNVAGKEKENVVAVNGKEGEKGHEIMPGFEFESFEHCFDLVSGSWRSGRGTRLGRRV